MTKSEALAIVTDIASRWGENAEEAFLERIRADMTDDDVRALVVRGEQPTLSGPDAMLV